MFWLAYHKRSHSDNQLQSAMIGSFSQASLYGIPPTLKIAMKLIMNLMNYDWSHVWSHNWSSSSFFSYWWRHRWARQEPEVEPEVGPEVERRRLRVPPPRRRPASAPEMAAATVTAAPQWRRKRREHPPAPWTRAVTRQVRWKPTPTMLKQHEWYNNCRIIVAATIQWRNSNLTGKNQQQQQQQQAL